MKKILITFLLLICPHLVLAATWYLRSDGTSYGTSSTTCNGSADVAYSVGAGPNCAVKHLEDIMQYTSDDGSTTRGTMRISAGDTVMFSKSADTLYVGAKIGDVPTNCSAGSSYGCYLKPPPDNVKFYGYGYNTGCSKATRVQIYGAQGTRRIFDLTGSTGVDIECLELTDHSACNFDVGPTQCSKSYGSDVGDYARDGIYANGVVSLTLKNLDIHGFSNNGGTISQWTGGGTIDHVNFDGNGKAGIDGDLGGTTAWSGTFTVNYVKARFNGCLETYPRSTSFSTGDYASCTDQNAVDGAGYGDGWGFNTTGGDFNIKNSEWSHNTQDGFDLLYHNSGNVKIDKSLFEGNTGNQLKVSGQNVDVTNSILITNCDYLEQASKVYNTGTFNSCRSGDASAISLTPLLGSTFNFFNDTYVAGNYVSPNSIFTNYNDRYGTCNGTETYKYSNLILQGYNASGSPYYNSTLAGACQTAFNNSVTDHSDIYNFSTTISGTGVVSTNPNFSGSFSETADSNVSYVAMGLTSPGKGNGSTNTFWNTSKDYNIFSQNSPIDMGAFQYTSTLQLLSNGNACVSNTDCSSGSCSNFVCAGGIKDAVSGSLKFGGSLTLN